MYIFNQGKYKSLHAQAPGELDSLRRQVAQDKHFRPSYHLAPPTGLLNDPNGLLFDGEKYHIFYQWFPFDALHGMKHWQHFTTTDFQTFTAADMLIPDELFESHGCYSGGAILWQDKVVAFYTGNTRRASDNQRIPHQNMAIFDKSGKLLDKRCIMDRAPDGYTEHVRDPKPFITADGKIRFVLGAQRQDLSGTALVYEMVDLDDTPTLLSELAIVPFDNDKVFMWECPDLFQLDDKDVFIWSPQGKARETTRFQNNYHATYALGKLDGTTLHAEHIEELDYGFDFYAPQTIQNGSGIVYGWIGLPDLTYPTDVYKWHSMLTLPRQLSIKDGRLYQQPTAQIYAQLKDRQVRQLAGTQHIDGLETAYLQIQVENQPLAVRFFDNPQGQHLSLRYENGIVSLDRRHTTQTSSMATFGTLRQCEIANLQYIEIFFDRSVVEIFLNHGEKVLTSRFFIEDRQNCLTVSRPVHAEIAQMAEIIYR